MKIIGFVGMPGSGKSVASDTARSIGLKVAVMGDVIREEAARQGLAQSDENLGRVGNMLRAREGPEAVARRTLQAALNEKSETNFEAGANSRPKIIVIDGLRSKAEVDFFRANADEFHLIEIVAPAKARVKWISSRGRPDDPKTGDKDPKIVTSCKDDGKDMAEALERRECRELSWGMYEAMRESDLTLENEGDLEEFRSSVRELLRGLIRD